MHPASTSLATASAPPARRRTWRWVAALSLLTGAVLAMLALWRSGAEPVYVLDAPEGDQLQLKRQDGTVSRVRLAGIEAGGSIAGTRQSAKLHLSQIAFGRPGEARCSSPRGAGVEDGLVLCRVLIQGVDLSLAQLDAGHARYSERHAGAMSAAEREQLQQREAAARTAKKGMWVAD